MSIVSILILISSILLLLLLVIKFKLNAFISLLLVTIFFGIAAGQSYEEIIKSIQKGMGDTLGFIAIVVGLGAIFGQVLESSGGANALASHLLKTFGEKRSSLALTLTGFIIAIPVFFDVGFILFVPVIYSLARNSGKSLLKYAIPLLAGLAVAHAFVPPTPGPVAVADIIDADMGWTILFGIMVGLPTALIAGPWFGNYIGNKIKINVPSDVKAEGNDTNLPSFRLIVILITIPLVLILARSVLGLLVKQDILSLTSGIRFLIFVGHPFSALIIATLLSMYWLGIKRGLNPAQLRDLVTKGLGPAGIIILITGAGGVFKQMLVDTEIGSQLAEMLLASPVSPLILAYLMAAIIRITQGSATVAMITAAGFISPFIAEGSFTEPYKALIVLAIAAGATILSHVNDSGFWLVGKYLGMTEKQTLQSWSVMETIVSVIGFILILILSFFIS